MAAGDATQHLVDRKFPDGSIIKVVFRNFLTYEEAELRAGENLNLIIGSNGSGKSTVICGICLAVGGSPKNLGRSERLTDYVRHDTENGFVEVHIQDARKGTQRMKIVLHRSNHFEYHINGSKSTQKAVREIAASYNIQVDNPCTFLAQDKVKSFSEQNPMELLRNTEKAGNPQLFEKHEELIQRKEDFGKLKSTAKQTVDALKDVIGEMDRLKPRVDNYKQKKEQDSKIYALHQKHSIFTFSEEQDKFYKKNKDVTEAEKATKSLEQEMNQDKATVEKQNSQIRKVQDSHKTAKLEFNDAKAFVNTYAKEDFYDNEIQTAQEHLAAARRKHDVYESEVKKLQTSLEGWKEKLQEAKEDYVERKRSTGNLQEALDRLEAENDAVGKEENDLGRDGRKLKCQKDELAKLKRQRHHVFDEKLNLLKTANCHEVADAWIWIQENLNKFDHPIYVPFFHICVARDKAHILENILAFRDSTIFICGSRKDEATLAQYFRRVSTTVMESRNINVAQLTTSIPSRLQQMGFDFFVGEIFTAPDPVKQYLCNINYLHTTPVGGGRVNDHYDDVVNLLLENRMRVFIAGNQRCQITVSKYSGERLTSNTQLRDARLYTVHSKPVGKGNDYELETQQLLQMERELQRRCKDVAERRNRCDEENNAIKEKEAKIKNARGLIDKYQNFIDRIHTQLEEKKESQPNMAEAEKRFAEAKERASKKTLAAAKKLIAKMEKMASAWREMVLLDDVLKNVNQQFSDLQHEMGNKKHKYLELYEEAERLRIARDNQKHRMGVARKKMYELCQVRLVDRERMAPAEQATWDKLQKMFEDYGIAKMSMDDLEVQIEEEKAKRTLQVLDGSQQDVERYESLVKEQANLEEEAKKHNDTVTNFSTIFAKDIADWKEPVLKLVEAISKNYTRFFAGIGCVGAVQLSEPDDALDISGYGIQIMVSFRATDRLRRLDHQVQSGGERSVSTMLYILALQELCPVPFRCVDEINQGMDPTNERKVFDIMVKTLTGDGKLAKTQYFLLTPKLLRGLAYNEKVTIQTVHNSRSICSTANQWSPYTFLGKMKSLKA